MVAAPLAESVLIISLDTLRADRLGAYGYEPRRTTSTSPNLDALARRSFVFEKTRAAASQTAPSHASLFTSTSLGVHGVINVHGAHPRVHKLPAGVVTLAERAQLAGHETAAFVSGGNLSRRMDLDRGFDVWDETFEGVRGRMRAALSWMLAPGRGPFLAVLHTYQVHAPYLPPRELADTFASPSYTGALRSRLEEFLQLPEKAAWEAAVGPAYWEGMLEYDEDDVRFLSDLYDAEIRHLDSVLRDLIEILLKDDLRDRLAIVVLSDHGEEFRDHGKYQHDQLFEEHLRVPLMFKLPVSLEHSGWKGRSDVPVSLLDVAPTVSELLGIGWEADLWQGRSLVPLLAPERAESVARFADRPIFSELILDPGPQFHSTVSFNGWKLMRVHNKKHDLTVERLFHLEQDPLEQRNLIESETREASRAREALRGLLEARQGANLALARRVGDGLTEEMDAEMEARMRALGYIGR